jgi:octaprenyl-diphosphate synthase
MPPVAGTASLRSFVGHARLSKRILNDTLAGIIDPVRQHFDDVLTHLDSILTADVPTVDAVSRYVAATKGKCLRPALVLLAAQACGSVTHQVRLAAVSMELLQVSTLLHDDVIDQSVIRRGVASVNARWNNETAVLMGDILFTQALSTMLETASLPVMKIAAAQTRRMIEGEVHARDQRRSPDFTEDNYLDLISRKTASLLSLATEAGARLSDANDEQIKSLACYGNDLGMAFQIVDDVLDVVGNPSIVGKPTGQDLREGTVTLPLIRALRAAPSTHADKIRSLVEKDASSDGVWDVVHAFIEDYEGVSSALDTASDFARRARTYLDPLLSSPARDSLDRMVGYVIKREQ